MPRADTGSQGVSGVRLQLLSQQNIPGLTGNLAAVARAGMPETRVENASWQPDF